MIQAKCIEKFRDKQGRIYGYRLIDLNGKTQDVTPDNLKNAIKTGKINIVNLTLTSDNRLIDKETKQLQSKELGEAPKRKVEKHITANKSKNLDNIQVSELAKSFSFIDWVLIELGDSLEEVVTETCREADIEISTYTEPTVKNLLDISDKAYQILIDRRPECLTNYMQYIVDEEYKCNSIKNYMYAECVNKLSESRVYKAIYEIYQYFKNRDKKLAKKIKENIIDDMKTNGIASIKMGYEIGNDYFNYLDSSKFGTVSNDVFTVGHAISGSDIKEHKEYKGYNYVFHSDINKCGAPRISIAAFFKNADENNVRVDIKIERHGYLSESRGCVGIRGYILDVESFTLNKNTPKEENSKIIANKFNEIAPKLYDLADVHQSLYSNLDYNKQLEKVSLDDLNSHGKQSGSLLVNKAISRWTTIRGDRTPAKEYRSEYNSDTNFRILYHNNISESGEIRRLFLTYDNNIMTIRVVNGNNINDVVIEERAKITGSVVDNSMKISELLVKAIISANVRRI